VGIRYYTGTAHPGEYVQLIREPNNAYDKNAIRVDNMKGIKVGHIKATVAVALAPVMDTLKQVKIDGTIPYAGNAYTLPLNIEMYGESADDQARVDAMFKRYRLYGWNPNRALIQPPDNKPLTAAAVEVVKTTIDWKTTQQNLDDMFEKISKEQLEHLPAIPMPVAITAKLLEHQTEGIRWLYQRETDTKDAPFYKQVRESGKNVWLSEITNSSQPEAPAPVKGSIL
jgi:SWI/SNF-related matrix-associated actin-dependent regulator of chromatin subfamily A3